ncbi:MAG: DUF4169 family protein [Parvibaculum sp.]|uniref:DUF4169 family protein n=1 Tax=Parvibaculum sp. TaxID=2024848 RepID=UPI0025E83F51|nr:DUF4169 family protein [Parvibaculum sp.]MCE9650833.1 DUF4169 family protein [Parvibaculum sp.]
MVSDGGNILNFARFRKISREEKKQRDRKQKEADAAANRVRFGRTGSEKKLTRILQERDSKAHDGLRRESQPSSAAKDEPEKPAK